MWDNPRLLNLAANALYGVAAFIVLCIALIAIVNSRLFPLQSLSVRGDVQHLDAASVERALAGRVKGNFFAVDLVAIRDALESLPWVRRVTVRREWPDRLVAVVEEHQPLAYWRDARLVNTHGELFQGKVDAPLPRFGGPDDDAATTVAQHYREFADLVAGIGMRVTKLELSARHAWQLELSGDQGKRYTVMMGREQPQQTAADRLRRFVVLYPQTIAPLNRSSGHIDLRYPNGFAMRVPGLEKLETENKGSAAKQT